MELGTQELPQVSWDEFTPGEDLSDDLAAWVCAEALEGSDGLAAFDFGDGPAVWLRPTNLATLIH